MTSAHELDQGETADSQQQRAPLAPVIGTAPQESVELSRIEPDLSSELQELEGEANAQDPNEPLSPERISTEQAEAEPIGSPIHSLGDAEATEITDPIENAAFGPSEPSSVTAAEEPTETAETTEASVPAETNESEQTQTSGVTEIESTGAREPSHAEVVESDRADSATETLPEKLKELELTETDCQPHEAEESITPTELDAAGASEPEPLSEEELRERVLLMQSHLGTVLESVTEIKNNCTRLKSENKFIQEYIETLLTRR